MCGPAVQVTVPTFSPSAQVWGCTICTDGVIGVSDQVRIAAVRVSTTCASAPTPS